MRVLLKSAQWAPRARAPQNSEHASRLHARQSRLLFQARVLGPWVIYEIRPKDSTCTTPVSVMRVPLAGGPPEQVLKAPVPELRCGRVSCMAIACSQDLKQFVFSALDPIQGLGRELARVDNEFRNYAFSLSPDGTRIAVLASLQQDIDIYPVSGAAPWKVKVKDWPTVDNVNWAADGKGTLCLQPHSSWIRAAACRSERQRARSLGTTRRSPDSRHTFAGWPSPRHSRVDSQQ